MKLLVIYPSGFSRKGGYSIVAASLHSALKELNISYISIVCDDDYESDADYSIVLRRREKWLRFILSFLTRYPALIYKYYSARGEIQRILDLHSDYEIWLDDNVFGFLFEKYSKRICVQRNHDLLWYSYRNVGRGAVTSRIAWNFELRRIQRYERHIYKGSCQQIFLTREDAEWLEKHLCVTNRQKIKLLSLYTDIDNTTDFNEIPRCNLLYVGRIDEKKSLGLLWFVENVLPDLHSDIKLVLVGNNDSGIRFVNSRIIELGFVENIQEQEANSFAYVNPQIDCSGIQVKNINMLNSGLPVCVSPESAQGLVGIDLFEICSSKREWVDKINFLFREQIVHPSNRLKGYSKQVFIGDLKNILNDL